MIVLMCSERDLARWIDETAQDQFDGVCEKADAPQEEVLAELAERQRRRLGLLLAKPAPCVKGVPLGRGGM